MYQFRNKTQFDAFLKQYTSVARDFALPSITRTPSFEGRCLGLITAAAVGDALGAGYEFATPPLEGTARMIGGGLGNFKVGEWTDDTIMSNAILAAFTAVPFAALEGPCSSFYKPYDFQRILQETISNFVTWFASTPADIGIQTRSVLKTTHDALENAGLSKEELVFAALDSALSYQKAHPENAGNGALMRTSVLALQTSLSAEELAKLVVCIASFTHPHPKAVESCLLWTFACRIALATGDLVETEPLLKVLPPSSRGFWRQVLNKAEESNPALFTPNGYTVTALQAAFSAIKACQGVSSPIEASLQKAISIGDDTDTISAIAGGLLGAMHGYSAIFSGHVSLLQGFPSWTGKDLFNLTLQVVAKSN